ncbi:MAG: bifunctional demethylmenaquinone methyltransferase/2-methoxy-6-polyprenyl-1,4-benzoquinol methylase UbiE [Bacteroidales bacterium]|nr:bifunctional demethylmenaquinone methyltransferase/2-methoxy-6-polyprenyl-1,4-benzoquinol methylase UbiE [Bacteroidales bacterium]
MTKSEQPKGKKDMVQGMFNDIAPKYDLLNHLLSADIDKIWRKKLRKKLAGDNPKMILDVASGTGDLAIELAKMPVEKIIGIDIAADMLEIGKVKVRKRGLDKKIQLQVGDSEAIDFVSEYFDAVTVAFGVRNYEDLGKGLKEMQRVLKPGGKVAVLEFSKPSTFPMKNIYWFYFKYILPVIGKMVSRHSSAYTYLPDSVAAFPEGEVFMEELRKAGFKNPVQNRLTFGIATLYIAEK